MLRAWFAAAASLILGTAHAAASDALQIKPSSMSDVIAASKASDWRPLDPPNTLYVELASGRVVIELAPAFAPQHVANIKALVHEHYFDGLAIYRAQDNYVVEWGDAERTRPVRNAQKTLAAEFSRSSKDLPFTVLPDPDTYAAEVGFVDGLPAAREARTHLSWLAHCYGMVGAGRDNDVDSGGGTELYVVIGNAPRHLDRNVTLVGRVVSGIELLSTLKRGTGPMGVYEHPAERTPIRAIRLAADVPEAERTKLEVMRTDTQTFADLVEARRNRREEWFKVPAGHIELCNVPLVVRPRS
ncbi:MAG TPA: peptidylprolyl isomerase [Steroidobacteraceae bacterium]